MRRLVIALATTAVLLPAASAGAAEPAAGTVSAATPSAAWSGTLIRPYLFHNLYNYETPGTVPCEAPSCDTYTLDVKTSADLTITVQSEQTSEMSMRIKNPANEWTYVNGWSDTAKPTTYKLKKAATGTYVINVVARVFGSTNPTAVDDTADYKGVATLAVPQAATTTVAPVTTVTNTTTTTTPAAPAQPAAKKKASCKAKARKIKNAKKRKKALKRCAKKRR